MRTLLFGQSEQNRTCRKSNESTAGWMAGWTLVSRRITKKMAQIWHKGGWDFHRTYPRHVIHGLLSLYLSSLCCLRDWPKNAMIRFDFSLCFSHLLLLKPFCFHFFSLFFLPSLAANWKQKYGLGQTFQLAPKFNKGANCCKTNKRCENCYSQHISLPSSVGFNYGLWFDYPIQLTWWKSFGHN